MVKETVRYLIEFKKKNCLWILFFHYYYFFLEKCQYKGVAHNQGERWDDGCSLECECLDEHTGRYRCQSKYV